jgi:hypothetical protein
VGTGVAVFDGTSSTFRYCVSTLVSASIARGKFEVRGTRQFVASEKRSFVGGQRQASDTFDGSTGHSAVFPFTHSEQHSSSCWSKPRRRSQIIATQRQRFQLSCTSSRLPTSKCRSRSRERFAFGFFAAVSTTFPSKSSNESISAESLC